MRRLRPPSQRMLREVVTAALRQSDAVRCMHRLDAMLLLGAGHSCCNVGRWLGEDSRTVQRWLHAYEMRGLKGLQERHCGGHAARLLQPQMRQLRADILGPPGSCGHDQAKWSGKLLALHVDRRYGVALSVRHCQRMLKDLSAH